MAAKPSSDVFDQCVSRIAYSFRYKMGRNALKCAPKQEIPGGLGLRYKDHKPMPGNITHSHYRYNRLASFLLADRAQKLKLKYAFLPI